MGANSVAGVRGRRATGCSVSKCRGIGRVERAPWGQVDKRERGGPIEGTGLDSGDQVEVENGVELQAELQNTKLNVPKSNSTTSVGLQCSDAGPIDVSFWNCAEVISDKLCFLLDVDLGH